jgi:hypothetical protein
MASKRTITRTFVRKGMGLGPLNGLSGHFSGQMSGYELDALRKEPIRTDITVTSVGIGISSNSRNKRNQTNRTGTDFEVAICDRN